MVMHFWSRRDFGDSKTTLSGSGGRITGTIWKHVDIYDRILSQMERPAKNVFFNSSPKLNI